MDDFSSLLIERPCFKKGYCRLFFFLLARTNFSSWQCRSFPNKTRSASEPRPFRPYPGRSAPRSVPAVLDVPVKACCASFFFGLPAGLSSHSTAPDALRVMPTPFPPPPFLLDMGASKVTTGRQSPNQMYAGCMFKGHAPPRCLGILRTSLFVTAPHD